MSRRPAHLRHPLAFAAAALAAAAPGLARAYGIEHTPSGAELHWAAFPIDYQVDLGGVASADRRWVLRTLRRGPESWTLPPASAASFRYAGTTAAGLVAGDGVTSFAYVTRGWPADLGDPGITAAATLLTYDDTTGVVSEADVGVNAEGYRFADEQRSPDAYDLWSISAHEAGHVLGLAHDCDGPDTPACDPYDPAMTASLMYPAAVPGDTSRRIPSLDDLEGLAHLYPHGGATPPDGEVVEPACPSDPLRFVPAAGAPAPTAFELVDADSGALTRTVFFSAEEDGDHLAVAVPAGHVLDLVAVGASGKARAFYGALTPIAPCGADGGVAPPPVAAGCGCDPAPGEGGAGLFVVLALAGALLTRSRAASRRGRP